jgi:uncharacterized protein involved in oxidation of intracellular sulfur
VKVLLVLNEAPYGSERFYTAMRLATSLLGREEPTLVRLFLASDAVIGALPGQQPSQGYSIEKMLRDLIEAGAEVEVCVTCIESRGLRQLALIPGIRIGNMPHLAEWVAESDRVLVF